MSLTPTSTIEAVNEILSAIGESPVSVLGTDNEDVNLALQRLDESRKSVLQKGLWFNTVEDYVLTPDTAGEYVLPADTISASVAVINSSSKQWAERQRKMYNVTDQTFGSNTSNLKVRLVQDLEFEDLPQAARHLVYTMAARKFANRMIGAIELARFTSGDERTARGLLLAEHLRQRKTNALNTSAARRTLSRRR